MKRSGKEEEKLNLFMRTGRRERKSGHKELHGGRERRGGRESRFAQGEGEEERRRVVSCNYCQPGL